MWKSTFVDACIATINDKSKSVCLWVFFNLDYFVSFA